MDLKPFLNSNKTTLLAVIAFLMALLGAFQNVLDGNPDTVPDWNVVVIAGAVAVNAVGNFFSRDADKSTEDSKSKE